MATLSRFKYGNPNSNAAAWYSAAMKRWEQSGRKGPPPERPPELSGQAIGQPREAVESESERARRIQQERRKRQTKLF